MTDRLDPPALELPADLSRRGFALRAESDDDISFLAELYASTRESELASVPWTPEQKRDFLLQQFDAQRRHYRTHFIGCAFAIIEWEGAPVGRLYVERRAKNLHVIDIALSPRWRGQGVGTQIMTMVIETARRDGRGVGMYVEKFNPALSLYRRLGFVDVADEGVYLEMELSHSSTAVN
jgi:ribosomal protein S18 acetylase RimI-like enzyme